MIFRIFDKYILKEIIPPFLIGLIVYSFTMLMNNILELTELLISKGASISLVLKLMGLFIPGIIAFTLPMSTLMGILAGLSRLSTDWEVMAFKSLGISLIRFLRPILAFSVVIWLLTFYIASIVAPKSNYKLVEVLYNTIISQTKAEIAPGEFNEKISNWVIYIQNESNDIWKNIFITVEDEPEESKLVISKGGTININKKEKKASFEFFNGIVHTYSLKEPEKYSTTKFYRSSEPLDPDTLFPPLRIQKRVREKDIFELLFDVKKFIPHSNQWNSHQVEIHKKIALPFACIIFSILGLPLGISTKKGGRTSGFAISLGFIIVYYIIITAGENLAMDGKVSPFLGMWGANIIFGFIGSYLFLRSYLEKPGIPYELFSRKKVKLGMREEKKEFRKREGIVTIRLLLPRFIVRFPNIIDRYIIKKHVKIFLLSFLSLSFIFVLITFFELLDDIFEHKRSISFLFQYVWFYFPQITYWVLPISILMSTLLTFGILSKTNEITAIKASGISLYRISVPVLLISVFFSIFLFFLQENLLPHSNKRADELKQYIRGVDVPQTYMRIDRRWMMSRDRNRIFHYKYFDPHKKVFSEISIFNLDKNDFSLKSRYFGVKGYLGNGYIELENAWIREFDEEKLISFDKKNTVKVRVEEDSSYFIKEWKEPDQMNHKELKNYIKDLREAGFDTIKFQIDLNFKIAFPFVPFIMSLIAVPFSFSMGKRGALYGIGISIFIGIIYWGFLGIFKNLGYIALLSPFISAWGANLLFGFLGLYLFFYIKT
ncbi:MAG: LptF/LptG family permease [Acidobacteriota bacterium]